MGNPKKMRLVDDSEWRRGYPPKPKKEFMYYSVGNVIYNHENPNDEVMMILFLKGATLKIVYRDYVADEYDYYWHPIQETYNISFEGYGEIVNDFKPSFGLEPYKPIVQSSVEDIKGGKVIRYIILKPSEEDDPKHRRHKIACLDSFSTIKGQECAVGRLVEPDLDGNVNVKTRLFDDQGFRIRIIPAGDQPFLEYMDKVWEYLYDDQGGE